jgi:hypothetical protein
MRIPGKAQAIAFALRGLVPGFHKLMIVSGGSWVRVDAFNVTP